MAARALSSTIHTAFTASLEIPEVWSYLNMQQMYNKTELTNILELASVPYLKQINFKQTQFKTKQKFMNI